MEVVVLRRFSEEERAVMIVVAVSLVVGVLVLLGLLFYCVYCRGVYSRNWGAAFPRRILP